MFSFKVQSLAASSPPDSPEGTKKLRRAAACTTPLAQSSQVLTGSIGSAGEKPTVSVHGSSCGEDGGSGGEEGGSGRTSRRQELEPEQRGKAGEAAAHAPVVLSNNSIVPRLLR